MRVATFIFIYLLLTSCATSPVVAERQEIIYVKKGTTVIDVFNLSQLWVSHEDVDYLKRRDLAYGEFGGQLGVCSNTQFHCLFGGIDVVIPKSGGDHGEWSFKGINCTAALESQAGNARVVTCRRGHNAVTFVYSPRRGVVSYARSSQPEKEYELLGVRGLFAKDE